MPRVERFRIEDAFSIILRGQDVISLSSGRHLKNLATTFEGSPLAYSVWDENCIIASGGIIQMWPGVGEAWMMMGDDFEDYAQVIYRTCLRTIRTAEKVFGMKRIQAAVLASEPQFVAWAISLGWQKEGLMRKWGPDGSDFYMMARIK